MRAEARIRQATHLRLVPSPDVASEPAVVAEILSDGTVRPLDPRVRSVQTETTGEWARGQISDDRWMMWWERRSS